MRLVCCMVRGRIAPSIVAVKHEDGENGAQCFPVGSDSVNRRDSSMLGLWCLPPTNPLFSMLYSLLGRVLYPCRQQLRPNQEQTRQ